MADSSTHNRVHSDDSLRRSEGVSYQCKYEGSYAVAEAKGLTIVQRACDLMRNAKGRRKENGIKQAPIVEVRISVNGIKVLSGEETVSKPHMLSMDVDKISYIARDPNNRHYLAIVYENVDAGEDDCKYECTLLKHDVNKTREMVLTLNQAFDLAYQSRVKNGDIPSVSINDQVDIYKDRLKQLSQLLSNEKLQSFLKELKITEITEIKSESEMASNTTAATTAADSSNGGAGQEKAEPTAPAAEVNNEKQQQQPAPTQKQQQQQQQKEAELILDFSNDNAYGYSPFAPAAAAAAVPPPAASAAAAPAAAAANNPFAMDQFAPPAPPLRLSQRSQQQQQQQQWKQQQQSSDLMQLGITVGAKDEIEFDPLKM